MKEIVSSKNLCGLLTDLPRLIDKRLINHGDRVAYILSCMLMCRGGLEDFEIAEYALLAELHDIGALAVEKSGDMLKFENMNPMPHSIYGYLFLKYISPMGETAKIIMYSHVDWQTLKGIKFDLKDISNFLNLAGRIDLFHNTLRSKFDHRKLRTYENTKYSKETLDLFDSANAKYDIFANLESGEYKKKLDQLYNALLFSDEEKEKYLEVLLYYSEFKSDETVINTVTSITLVKEIAKKLGGFNEWDMRVLHYGALLHDIGMFTVPMDILTAPRALTPEELATMRRHVELASNLMEKHKIDPEVLSIVSKHHERIDGSGYPNRLLAKDLSKSDRIMQVADTVTSLISKRSYRKPKPKDAVIAILSDEVNHNKFDRPIVKALIDNYDEIVHKSEHEAEIMLKNVSKLNSQYAAVSTALVGKK